MTNTCNSKISILVVLYNIEIDDSITLKRIFSSNSKLNKCRLLIWNNGPNKLSLERRTILDVGGIDEVNIIEDLTNVPLSKIYNLFIDHNESDFYIILDHDSDLSDDYMDYICDLDKDVFLGMPKIFSNHMPCSPCINNVYADRAYNPTEKLTAIGSGLILSKKLVLLLKHAYKNVFDERYALYGVDSSLFYRIRKLNHVHKCIVIPGFEHSLSRLEKESVSVKKFRIHERSIDLGLTLRHYPNANVIKLFLIEMLKTIIHKNSLSITVAIKAFISGKHPRC